MKKTEMCTEMQSNIKVKKPTVKLTGEDGNAVVIMAKVELALMDAGYTNQETRKYLDECDAGNYENLLAVTRRWVKVIR